MKRKPKLIVYRAVDGWRWRLVAVNGNTLCSGEPEPTPSKARRGALAAQRNMAVAEVVLTD
jgi:uncharacterized protein YegP (UPF0339 family)